MAFTPEYVETGWTTSSKKSSIQYKIGTLVGDVASSSDVNSGTRTYLCTVAYDDATRFEEEMLGYALVSGGKIVRILPEPLVDDTDPSRCGRLNPMYALTMRRVKTIKHAENNSDGFPVWDQAVYQVTFGYPLYNVLEDDEVTTGSTRDESLRFVIWERKSAYENLRIPSKGFTFPSDDKQIPDETVIKTSTFSTIQAKWIDVPGLDYDVIGLLLGSVNSTTIVLDGTTYGAEQVLFETWSEVRRVNAFGDPTRDVIITFLIRNSDRNWNTLWRRTAAGEMTYEAPEDANGNKIFSSEDLNDIFNAVM